MGVGLVACGEARAAAPLTLMSSSPANHASGVARDAALTIDFSSSLRATALPGASVTLVSASGSQAVTLAVSGNRLIITPSSTLAPLTEYTLIVGTEVRGVHGEMLAIPLTIRFATRDRAWNELEIEGASGLDEPDLRTNRGAVA